ncbi:hypothetical protein GQX74_000326 [Glossina fuscipes]|nr:hypothetical protein GQX74_000326 [Glossina fuscipes]
MDTTTEATSQVVTVIQAGQKQSQVAWQLNSSRYVAQYVRQAKWPKRCSNKRDVRLLYTTSLRNRPLNALQLEQPLQEVREVEVPILTFTPGQASPSEWTMPRDVENILEEHPKKKYSD